VIMYRSPGAPPKTPACPLLGTRTREPVSTPGGILTAIVSRFGIIPSPLQVRQRALTFPDPPQRAHAKAPPRRFVCRPLPLHSEQAELWLEISPVPLQSPQTSLRSTSIVAVKPSIASSNSRLRGNSRSVPRVERLRAGEDRGLMLLNISENMSRKFAAPKFAKSNIGPRAASLAAASE